MFQIVYHMSYLGLTRFELKNSTYTLMVIDKSGP